MSGFDENEREEGFGYRVREAFEAMGPSPEARERMLTALKRAETKRDAESGATSAAPTDGNAGASEVRGDGASRAQGLVAGAPSRTAEGGVRPVSAPSRRSRRPAWWIGGIAAAAACLVLVVGVGLYDLPKGAGSAPESQAAASLESIGDAADGSTAASEGSGSQFSGQPVMGLGGRDGTGAIEYGVPSAPAADADGWAGSGEGYADAGESGFISAAERPLSTFSADVDTASYANLRRLVRAGAGFGTIDPGAVRIEEMLNYFGYDYDSPEGGEGFALTARAGACPWNPESELVVLGIAAGEQLEEAPATNLVLLIDVSGSMGYEDKLPLLKQAMARIVEGLRPQDRVSVVTYSGNEEVVLEGATGDEKNAIMDAVNGLEANGSTNGQAGLQMAYRVAESNHIPGGVNRIVMASDGDLNVGISSVEELEAFVSEKRGEGTYLSVLGFGTGNYQDAKMEALADNGNGSYHYIDSADEAVRVYNRSLAAGAVPVADDVKLQVEFDPVMVESYRLVGYDNRALADEDFRNDAADAGEVCAGSQLTVAYEVVLTEEARSGEGDAPWLACTVRYQPAGKDAAQAPREQRFEVGRADWSADPGADWSLAAAVIEFGMLARDSQFVGSASADQAIRLAEASVADLDATDRASRRELSDLIAQAQAQV